MYGLILFDKGKIAEAETCLLTLTLTHPRWPEGWGALYFYYNEVNNIEGMELAMQMANKHINGTDVVPDYFSSTDDLAWSTQLCTEHIYSKTAVLFIKLRLFEVRFLHVITSCINNYFPAKCTYSTINT